MVVRCARHGRREAVAVCPHLLEGKGGGWHFLGSGDDERPDAICFACRDAWDPDLSATEAGIEISVICTECYDELRAAHEAV